MTDFAWCRPGAPRAVSEYQSKRVGNGPGRGPAPSMQQKKSKGVIVIVCVMASLCGPFQITDLIAYKVCAAKRARAGVVSGLPVVAAF